jgi:hypothetical protein
MSKTKQIQVTKADFKAAMDRGEPCYMKKPKSWKCTHYKWKNLKEKWFVEVTEDVRKGKVVTQESAGLRIATQMDSHYKYYENEGYSFYIGENE